ncbi:MAG: PEGA domain-containing protein, partial [Deltaproteobacteria bacterium]|nr:PEGA domain-containing protein [Deltaproteobacteria bacterium]
LLVLLIGLPVAGIAMYALIQASSSDPDPGKVARTEVHKTVVKTATSKIPPGKPKARVTVDSSPRGARALIDNIPIGNTPAAADVAVGHHQIAVELPGYRRVARPLEVRDAKPITVPVRLEKDPAAPHPTKTKAP